MLILSYSGMFIEFDYLQRNWYTEQALIKSILQFYSKAKAFEQIVGFMIKWCDIEASRGEYERAMKVLKEATNNYGSRIQPHQYHQLQCKKGEIGDLMTKFLPNERDDVDDNKTYISANT